MTHQLHSGNSESLRLQRQSHLSGTFWLETEIPSDEELGNHEQLSRKVKVSVRQPATRLVRIKTYNAYSALQLEVVQGAMWFSRLLIDHGQSTLLHTARIWPKNVIKI